MQLECLYDSTYEIGGGAIQSYDLYHHCQLYEKLGKTKKADDRGSAVESLRVG